ncbi:MAG: DUF4178 domain-containing protein [Novosphingobium sp.]
MTAAGKAITCPACGGTIEIRAAGFSVNLACQHCGSLLDVSRPEVALIRKYKRANARFALELGKRGMLFGREWEVVGALRRKDQIAIWQEFLLFNPYLGYRWLVVADGEWQFGTPLADRPQGDRNRVFWRSDSFTRLGRDQQTSTTAVSGEFYWRVKAGDMATATLFQSGDTMLSREVSAGEENWTQLVRVSQSEIEQAFGLNRRRLPHRKAPRGLMRFRPQAGLEQDDLGRMFMLALASSIFAVIAMAVLAGPSTKADTMVQIPVGGQISPVRVGTITVRRPWQFVTIDADASQFENRWIDLEYNLVNRSSEQSIDAFGLVEHYAGTDSDGAWTEGSRHGDTMFGHVPRGTYDVYVSGSAHGWPVDPQATDAWGSAETIDVWIEAETGAMSWGMWWTLVIALFAWPLTVLWWRFRDK